MMERRVKERLIGASILVALIVLVVPELLSGPKPTAPPPAMLPVAASEPVRNVTVDLSTNKPPPNSEAEALDAQPAASAANAGGTANSAQPDAAASSPAAASTAPVAPVASAKRPQSKPAPLESAPTSPISKPRGWSVQLGSFAQRSNADNLSRQLKGQGYSVYVLPGGSGSSTRYRVRVGPLADRESAERMAARLKSQGHVGSLVAPAA